MSNYKIGSNMPDKPVKSGPIMVSMLEELEERNEALLHALNLIANTQYRTDKSGKVDKLDIDHLIRIAKNAIK